MKHGHAFLYLSTFIALSISLTPPVPLNVAARGGGGGGGGAPHMAAPAAPAAPHMAAPATPHMAAPAAPRMAAPAPRIPAAMPAPHFEAPRMAAPRMPAAMSSPHFGAPHMMAAPRMPAAMSAPHFGGPRMMAPRMRAAMPAPHFGGPRMSAPRMRAAMPGPHFGGPHMSAPRMRAAMSAPHFGGPRMSGPHMTVRHVQTALQSPRFAAHGGGAPHMQLSHSGGAHAGALHFATQHAISHANTAHLQASPMTSQHPGTLGAHAGRIAAGQRPTASTFIGGPSASFLHGSTVSGGVRHGGQMGAALQGMGPAKHIGMAFAGLTAAQTAARYSRMQPQVRDRAFASLDAGRRAQTIDRMNQQQRAEAMYKMTPQQRAETMAHMSPTERRSFLAPGAERNLAGQRNEHTFNTNRTLEHAVTTNERGFNNRYFNGGNRGELRNDSARMMAGAAGIGAMGDHLMHQQGRVPQVDRVPRVPPYANPRIANQRAGLSREGAEPLRWRGDFSTHPHAGDRIGGRPGAIDPGGYIRFGRALSSVVTPSYACRQFDSYAPDYASVAALNDANIVTNPAAWPWTLPPYAPAWFSSWNGPWNWPINWYANPGWGWNSGWNTPWTWDTNYYGYGGLSGWLDNFLPWGCNTDLGWVPSLNYYSGYTLDGVRYPHRYFATRGFVPTHYIFDVSTGQFYLPGVGYTDRLPPGFVAPITVAVQESVPEYMSNGEIAGYRVEPFQYNAFWDPQAQAYGFYNYRQQFEYLTFPWLSSWEGSYIENSAPGTVPTSINVH